MVESGYRFLENPDAPEIFCHRLHDVQFINGIARFVPVALRQEGNQIIGQPPAIWLIPGAAVEHIVELVRARLPCNDLCRLTCAMAVH